MNTELFNFHLPEQQIAQFPLDERDATRLLVLDRAERSWRDSNVRDLPQWLNPGDLLVFNDTRVIPARMRAFRDSSGGKVEILLVPETERDQGSGVGGQHSTTHRVLTRSGGKLLVGEVLTVGGTLKATIRERGGEAGDIVEFHCTPAEFAAFMERHGEVPLPPYVRREPGPSSDVDRMRYQTLFAHVPGAVAAPTAGLHFTERLLSSLTARGVQSAFVTLHVGPGTFKPVKAEIVEEHYVDPEPYSIPAATVAAIHATRAAGKRVIAVGTTSLRALESCADELLKPGAEHEPIRNRSTELYVYPPYQFRVADGLMSNFHIPKSSLLMLVAAFAAPSSTEGIDFVKRAYLHAIEAGYRFYSYGDACLFL